MHACVAMVRLFMRICMCACVCACVCLHVSVHALYVTLDRHNDIEWLVGII